MNFLLFAVICLALSIAQVQAQNTDDDCLLKELKAASPQTTMAEITAACHIDVIKEQGNLGVISKRIIAERASEFDPFVLTPHKRNYILPITITDNLNTEVYQESGLFSENIENKEAKYQLSLKVPLNSDNIFFPNDRLYIGMTLTAWWQIYADNISKPFRETNYQPEIFYFAPTDWHPFGGNVGLGIGFEHQSNGRSQFLSRSWNRLYGQFAFEKDNLVLALRPWYRLKEDEKEDSLNPVGDDNPDIEDYMGKFELYAGYKWNKVELTAMMRRNFSTKNGALQLEATFPITGRLLGYVQYFNGYGESLIDYNHSQQKIGLGFALTNYF